MSDMFGKSSMNSGASATLPIVEASFCQSCSSIFPERIRVRGTFASAATDAS